MKPHIALIAIIFSNGVCGAELPVAKPDDVGVSAERLTAISEFARRNVAEGKHVGVVTMVARHGKVVHFDAVGQYGLDNPKPMSTDALFRIFSMTKPVTSVAMMKLYEEGKFQMTDPVSKFLPQMKDFKIYRDGEIVDAKLEITIEQLMTHTAGLTYGWNRDHPVEIAYQEADLWNSKDLGEFIDRLSKIPLRFEPGTRYHYSVATDVLGAVIEKISGQSLDEFFHQQLFEPLQMTDTFFSVPENKRHRLTTNHTWNAEENKIDLLPPEYGRAYTDVTLFSGGGGLVSTAADYMIFCEMLRNGGSYDGIRILGPKTVQYMTINHLSPEVRNEGADEYPESHLYRGQDYGLGFGVISNPGISEVVSSAGEYSWGGAADTKFWIDPQEDLVAIIMTQLLQSPWPTRYQMKVATYQALTELGKD